MNKFITYLLVLLLVSSGIAGCSSKTVEESLQVIPTDQALSEPDAESMPGTTESSSDEIRPEYGNAVGANTAELNDNGNLHTSNGSLPPAEEDMYDENPYAGTELTNFAWCYAAYEIFRGAETIDFGDALYYKRDYINFYANEEWDWHNRLIKYTCEITLPQAIHGEPWADQINAYYQSIMQELITEGDDIWNENSQDFRLSSLTYYFGGAYRISNVVTVMRSHFYDGGGRSYLNWTPFADLFSAHDGQRLELDDLFCVEQDEYLPVLYASLLNAENRFGEFYTPEIGEFFRSYNEFKIKNFDKASVAVTPIGLVFIYPTYAGPDTASGIVFLDVPYEDLQGLLNITFLDTLEHSNRRGGSIEVV